MSRTIRVGGLEIPEHLLSINPHLHALAGQREGGTKGPRWKRATETTARREGDVVLVTVKGLVLVSEANERETWQSRNARKLYQQELIRSALRGVEPPPPPLRVTIVRLGPRSLDVDNAQGSGKHVADAIASWCGIDDGDVARWSSSVVQERGGYCVRITIEHVAVRGGSLHFATK